MSNRLAQTRPIFYLTAIAILYTASAAIPPAQAQPEAKAASILRDSPDRRLYIKPTAHRSLKASSVHRMKRHRGYVVDVTYPQFKGADADLVEQLNRKAKSVVNANIPNKPGEFHDYEYEYSSNYKNRFVSSDLVSAEFEFNLDTGGAHGVTTLVPFNYLITDSIKKLTLEDLFGKPVDYDTLANLCFTKLQHDYSEELLYDEADALLMKDQDFSIFTFDANGVTFSFNQGDIAPYDVGCPSVTLSYFELRKLISSGSPVHKFLERNAHARPHAIKAHCDS